MKRCVTFEDLVRRARQEMPPTVDVADGVLGQLHHTLVAGPSVYRPLVWVSSVASAAAACLAIATLLWYRQADGGAINDIYNTIAWVAQ